MKKLLFTVAFFATISLTAQTMAFTAVEIKAKDYTQKDIAEAFDKVFEGVKMNQAGVTLERLWMGSTGALAQDTPPWLLQQTMLHLNIQRPDLP